MKLIIAGSRTLTCPSTIISYYINFFNIKDFTEIVSGDAQGIDRSGETYARSVLAARGPFVTKMPNITIMSADWETHGKAAGPIRNAEMADYGDALLLIWDGISKGSSNMKQCMTKLGKPIYEVILSRTNC